MKDMIVLLLIGLFYLASIIIAYNIGRSTARRYNVNSFLESLKHHSDWENHINLYGGVRPPLLLLLLYYIKGDYI